MNHVYEKWQIGIYCAIQILQQMPMCGYYCDCYWCVVDHMASNDQFKQRMDQLVAEFKETAEFQIQVLREMFFRAPSLGSKRLTRGIVTGKNKPKDP